MTCFFLRKLLFLIILFLPKGLFGQHYSYKNFTIEHGLPSNVVYDIQQDDDGYIWLATNNGVSKYNGYSFSNFSTEDGLGDIEAFVFEKDDFGRIWVIGNSNRVSYIKEGKVYPYEFNSIILENLPGYVHCIGLFVDSAGSLHYSTTQNGQFVIHEDGSYSQEFFPTNDTVFLEVQDVGNDYLFYTQKIPSSPLMGKIFWTKYTTEQGTFFAPTRASHVGRYSW